MVFKFLWILFSFLAPLWDGLNEHDIYLGREILLIKPHQDKPGSKESGNAWSSIAEDLNKISQVHFDVNQKDVRDRCRNLLEKHKKKKERKENLAPMRKTLNLIIYCKTLQKNGMKLLHHIMINWSKSWKKLRLKKAIQRMYDNKLWRLSLKLEKENTKMTIPGANETETQKPWYILKIALNKKVILTTRTWIKKTRVSPSARKARTTATTTEFIPTTLMQQQQLLLAMFEKIVDNV